MTPGQSAVGPIAGLSYTFADIQGYTETGDSLLTMMVNAQNVDSLTGNAGLQMRVPFQLWGISTARSSTSPPSRICLVPAG